MPLTRPPVALSPPLVTAPRAATGEASRPLRPRRVKRWEAP